jgi:hypothetical protein
MAPEQPNTAEKAATEPASPQEKPAVTHWDPHSEAHARRRRVPKQPPAGWKGPRQK